MAQRFHTFRALSLDAAYAQMRQALGDDAVILRTTQVKDGGIRGFLGRTVVEVTASVPEPRPAPRNRPRTPAEQSYAAHSSVGSDERVNETVAYFQQLVSDAQRRMAQAKQVAPPPAQEGNAAVAREVAAMPEPQKEPAPETALRKEVHDIREMLQVLVAEAPAKGLPAEFAPHYRLLVERGVSRRIAAGLIAAVAKGADRTMLREPRVFVERLKMEIRKLVPVTGGVALTGGRRRVVALIGATGVGKTTNVAKLAAHFAVKERAKVALVTADTYRVAAPEQLRVYANIIGLPMEVVNEPREMAAALRRFADCDLVLIDTAGGSQFNFRQIRELDQMLQAARPDETMLLLAANTQLDDQRQVVASFKGVRPSSLLFTKLDETRRYGTLFSLLADAGLPLSYFSIGQNVPDDIMLARPATVAKLVLEGRNGRGRSSTKSS